MLHKICLITNYNLYESKRYFIEKLDEAMRRHGIETTIIDAQQTALGSDTIAAIRRFNPDFTCSFNSFETMDGRYMWDYMQIPHLSFLVDPSFYSTTLTNSPYSILSCVDRNDCEVIRSHGFENVFFLPHAVERELAPQKDVDRIYDVVFMGSCYDYESLRVSWQQRNSEALNKVLDDAIDLVLSNDTISVAQALVAAWNASGLDPHGIDFVTLYYYLDNYTRGKDRVELIRSIKNARIHVFGEMAPDNAVGILNWPQYLASQKNVTLHPSVPFGQGMDILKQAKIVLNSMPFFRDGSHERIFTALACGALPVTSESLYLHEQFQADEDLVFYQSARKNEVGARIDAWLGDEKKRQHVVEQGRQKVLQHHTWDNRVQEIMRVVPTMIARIKKAEGL